VEFLSGGNQQKVSLTRPFLRGDVKVILAEEPTQGVDVAARFDIYDALREKASEGVATIVKSSDPLELAGLCDRVVVMSRGRIVDEIERDTGFPADEIPGGLSLAAFGFAWFAWRRWREARRQETGKGSVGKAKQAKGKTRIGKQSYD